MNKQSLRSGLQCWRKQIQIFSSEFDSCRVHKNKGIPPNFHKQGAKLLLSNFLLRELQIQMRMFGAGGERLLYLFPLYIGLFSSIPKSHKKKISLSKFTVSLIRSLKEEKYKQTENLTSSNCQSFQCYRFFLSDLDCSKKT